MLVHRRYDPDRKVVLAWGDFGGLFASWIEHVRRWELPFDDLLRTMMQQGLAGLCLHVSCRPHDESVGLTLNFREPPINLFLTGDAPTSTVAGRAFVDGVRTAAGNRLFVQTQRPRQGAGQSMLDVQGLDVLEIFEQYYARSEQNLSRFFEFDGDRCLMVQGLPDSHHDWVAGLTPDSAREIDLTREAQLRRTFRFQCGCSPRRILGALIGIFRRDPEDLFRGESGVETFCPRCGARWWIDRPEFDAGLRTAAGSDPPASPPDAPPPA